MVKAIAVGFKVDKDRSVFYYKREVISDYDLACWFEEVAEKVAKRRPDFVSLRFVWNEKLERRSI